MTLKKQVKRGLTFALLVVCVVFFKYFREKVQHQVDLVRKPSGQSELFEIISANLQLELKPPLWTMGIAYRLDLSDKKSVPAKFKLLSRTSSKTNSELSVASTEKLVFEWASQTKIITAAVILYFEALGRLSLQDRLDKIFLELIGTPAGKIKIIELLRHTSGLPTDNTPANIKVRLGIATQQGEKASQFLLALKELSLNPQDKPNYSDLGYAVLGHVIAKLYRNSFSQAVQEIVFSPLKLSESILFESLSDLEPLQRKTQLLQGYDYHFKEVALVPWGQFSAAGSWVGSLKDMAKFLDFILQPSSTVPSEQQRIHSALLKGVFEIYGWDLKKSNGWVVKYGESNGFKSYMALQLEQRKWFILGVNSASENLDLLVPAVDWN